MLAKTFSATVIGIDAHTVEVEVNVIGGEQELRVSIVGLPDAAVRESKERVHSAVKNSGFFHPVGLTVIGLAPADLKKEGAAFDLPIALSLISTTGAFSPEILKNLMIVGELALDGTVRPVKGILPIASHISKTPDKYKAFIVPEGNACEAAIAAGNVPVYGVKSLVDAKLLLTGNSKKNKPVKVDLEGLFAGAQTNIGLDFAEVKGQTKAKRALEIAAAGGHNTLMIGPPGSGKSMLAKRLATILPPMNIEEALETTKIHSIAGILPPETPLVVSRPFRAPHHTISDAGLLGGQTIPTPGEISLAHNGILFLDELPEFKRNVLEVLRQPLEEGSVTISRAAGSFKFPARFVLIAAMNPCPCGYYGYSGRRQCRCGHTQIQRYRTKISGPLLDRIDLHIEVNTLSEDELMQAPAGEASAAIRERVIRARKIQEQRFASFKIHCNSQMSSKMLQEFCQLDKESYTLLKHSIKKYELSARAYDRILRTARTIADIAGNEKISSEHMYEAIQYRYLDKKLW